jgi:hypothetical protein
MNRYQIKSFAVMFIFLDCLGSTPPWQDNPGGKGDVTGNTTGEKFAMSGGSMTTMGGSIASATVGSIPTAGGNTGHALDSSVKDALVNQDNEQDLQGADHGFLDLKQDNPTLIGPVTFYPTLCGPWIEPAYHRNGSWTVRRTRDLSSAISRDGTPINSIADHLFRVWSKISHNDSSRRSAC